MSSNNSLYRSGYNSYYNSESSYSKNPLYEKKIQAMYNENREKLLGSNKYSPVLPAEPGATDRLFEILDKHSKNNDTPLNDRKFNNKSPPPQYASYASTGKEEESYKSEINETQNNSLRKSVSTTPVYTDLYDDDVENNNITNGDTTNYDATNDMKSYEAVIEREYLRKWHLPIDYSHFVFTIEKIAENNEKFAIYERAVCFSPKIFGGILRYVNLFPQFSPLDPTYESDQISVFATDDDKRSFGCFFQDYINDENKFTYERHFSEILNSESGIFYTRYVKNDNYVGYKCIYVNVDYLQYIFKILKRKTRLNDMTKISKYVTAMFICEEKMSFYIEIKVPIMQNEQCRNLTNNLDEEPQICCPVLLKFSLYEDKIVCYNGNKVCCFDKYCEIYIDIILYDINDYFDLLVYKLCRMR